MNILFNFINNANAINGTDYRAKTFKPLLYYMRDIGHHVFIDPHKKPGHPSFKPFKNLLKDFPIFSDKNIKNIQLWIVPYPHAKRKERYTYFLSKKIPIIMYEHGWLNQSVFVDRGELFSDAHFAKSIANMINENFDIQKCQQLQEDLLKKNISKRPQTEKWDIPNDIDGKYIFIPVQKIDDISVSQYSRTGMLDFITQTVKFAKSKRLEVVIKQHPHSTNDHQIIKQHIKQLRKEYQRIHIVDASIYHLMQHARFTACVNSGSIIDNFITQTPVLCVGKSFFYKSGAIIFDKNTQQGLNTMFNRNYNWDDIKQQQLKMLWWLRNNLLFANLEPKENMKRLVYNSQINI